MNKQQYFHKSYKGVKVIILLFLSIICAFSQAQTTVSYDQSGNRLLKKKSGTKPKVSTITGQNQGILFAGPESAAYSYKIANTANSKYQWSTLNGRIINGQGTSEVQLAWQKNAQSTGKLFMLETNSLGCTSDTAKYIVNFAVITATDPLQEQSVTIYPNPASQLLVVNYELSSSSEVNLSLSDVSGKLVLQENLGKQGIGSHQHTSTNINQLMPGVYFITLQTTEGKIRKKLIVEH